MLNIKCYIDFFFSVSMLIGGLVLFERTIKKLRCMWIFLTILLLIAIMTFSDDMSILHINI